MVNSITIQPVVTQSITPAVRDTDAPGKTQATANTTTSTGSTSQVGHANPSYQFDPAAGVVVIQFRNDSGKVELSIPNQQQLNAYTAQRSGDPTQPSDAVVA